MFNLKIKNYQIIENVDLSFSTGLNVITGANTSGKTAIFRAIQSLVLNSSYAKGHISHGAVKSEVEYTYLGDTVKWIRKPNTSEYEINGVLNSKCGREDLFTVSGIEGFVIDDNKFVNMSTEHDNLFPFYKTSTEIFKLFENIFQIEDTQVILNLLKKDDYSISKELNQQKDYFTKIENDLKIVNDFVSTNSSQTPELMYEELYSLNSELETVTRSKKQIQDMTTELEKLPEFELKTFDFNILSEFKSLNENVLFIGHTLNEINFLTELDLKEFNFKLLDDYKHLIQFYSLIQNLDKEVSSLDSEISMLNLNSVILPKELLSEYEKLISLYNELIESNNYLDNSKNINLVEFDFEILTEYRKLLFSFSNLTESIDEFKELNIEIPKLELELKSLNDKLFESGYCPVCKKSIGECNE